MYREGIGKASDPGAAFGMTLRTAEAGFPSAQYDLSGALFNGKGVARDEVRALYWLDKAVDSDYGPAFVLKAELIRKGKAPGGANEVERLLQAAIPSWNQARLNLADVFIDREEQDKLVQAAYLVQDCYAQALRDGDKPLAEMCLVGTPALIKRLERPVSHLSDAQLKEVLMARFQFDERGRPYPDRLARSRLFFETAAALAKAKDVNAAEERRLTRLLASGMRLKKSLASPPRITLPHPGTQRQLPGKVGRNDLCPCGSGDKFKRCCA